MDSTEFATFDALRGLADRAAVMLVADALQRLIGEPVTVHVKPVRKYLPRKAKKLKTAPPVVIKHAKAPVIAKPKALDRGESVSEAIAERMCRKCFKRGGTRRVEGTDKRLKCGSCGFEWNARGLPVTGGNGAPSPTTVKATTKDVCSRCDHDQKAHVAGSEECLVPRCVCREFYR